MAAIGSEFARISGAIADEIFLSFGIPNGHDVLSQMQFHREYGPQRDYAALRAMNPNLKTFETWLQQSGWRGEARAVQKGMITGEQ